MRQRADTVIVQSWSPPRPAERSFPPEDHRPLPADGHGSCAVCDPIWDTRPTSDEAPTPERGASRCPAPNERRSGVALLVALGDVLKKDAAIGRRRSGIRDGEGLRRFHEEPGRLIALRRISLSHLAVAGYRRSLACCGT